MEVPSAINVISFILGTAGPKQYSILDFCVGTSELAIEEVQVGTPDLLCRPPWGNQPSPSDAAQEILSGLEWADSTSFCFELFYFIFIFPFLLLLLG